MNTTTTALTLHDRRLIKAGSLKPHYQAAETGIEVFRARQVDGSIFQKGFSGKSDKAEFYYRHLTEKEADFFLSNWIDKVNTKAAAKRAEAEAKAARMQEPQKFLKVGDVIAATWGHEQTNVDYYQVTALIGKRMVEIREISQDTQYTGDMSGTCTPRQNDFIGEPLRRRVTESGWLKIKSYILASKASTRVDEDGKEVYLPDHWTRYA